MARYIVETTVTFSCSIEAKNAREAAAKANMLNVFTDMERIDSEFSLTNARTGTEYDFQGNPKYRVQYPKD